MPPAVAVAAAVVGGAVATSAAVVATVGTIGAMIVGGVVSTGINMLGSKLLGADKKAAASSAQDSGVMVNVQDNVASIPIVYGRRRIAGRQIYATTTGANNKYLHLVYAVAEGQIQEIERIVFGDNEIVFDGQVTPMTATSGSLSASQARGRFTNFVDLQWRLGTTSQTAFTSLVTETAGQEGAWTGDHKGLGVALIYLKIAYDKEKMNQVPTVFCDIKGMKVATSFGGGATWSDNPAACLLDYLTDTTYGKGLALTDIDQDSFNEVRDYCDEVVTLYTDTSAITGKRYLCNGFLDPDTAVFDNIKSLLSCFNGYLLWANGKYKIKVFKDETNTGFTFDESNIIGDIAMQLNSKETISNRVKASFYNSGLDYADDYAIWEDEDLRYQEDNEEILEMEISLPFTSDYTRALNLCKMSMEQSRRGNTVSFQATPDALRVEVGDRVWLSHPYLGFQDDYRVTGMILNPDKTVSVTLMQYDDNIYSLDAIATAPGPTTQARSTKFSGIFGVKPDAPTGITWYRFCPGAVEGIEEGYGINITAPTTGKEKYKTITFSGSGAVNATTNTISLSEHALETGYAVVYSNGGGTSIGGLTTGNTYYVIRVDASTIQLASSLAFANAGTFIDFTSAGVGLVHTLTYGGNSVAMDSIDYYKYTVTTSGGSRTFTANGTSVVMPAANWPSGTFTNIQVQAVANDGTYGEIGTSTSTIALNPDNDTFCPFRRPLLNSLFQICDGSSGVSAGNIMSTWPENIADVTGNAKKGMSGPGTSKWKIKWTGGPDTQWFTQYRVALTMSYNGTTFYTGTTATVSKTSGATESTVEEFTFANIATMPTFSPYDNTKDVVVSANVIGIAADARESLVPVFTEAQLTVNPTGSEECYLGGPKEVRYYQVCNGTGGTDATGTGAGQPKIINGRYQLNAYAQPSATLNSSRAQRAPQNVDAFVGFYIVHNDGGDKVYVDSYDVEFAVYKDDGTGVPLTTPSQTITANYAYNASTYPAAQYNLDTTVINFNDAGNVWVDLRVRAKRTVGGTDYYSQWKYMANGLSGDVQDAVAPPSGQECF